MNQDFHGNAAFTQQHFEVLEHQEQGAIGI